MATNLVTDYAWSVKPEKATHVLQVCNGEALRVGHRLAEVGTEPFEEAAAPGLVLLHSNDVCAEGEVEPQHFGVDGDGGLDLALPVAAGKRLKPIGVAGGRDCRNGGLLGRAFHLSVGLLLRAHRARRAREATRASRRDGATRRCWP